ncbi:aldo/keto reductase family oxidoreductase [Rheinheimera sp. 4Y26]|uniref:aldo/keto reductase n=1 Tax=Rheinheimera sp. 4Y26 TaxID=2977811 RepID=UPI0021B0BE10|nr:aldo/keto reductase [Rheinheimera sp. 4Y26]MCT6700712.1 aldo/keto reductase [Rheinheimera sp. 4Y26]
MQPILQTYPDAGALVFGCMGLGGEWNAAEISSEARRQSYSALDAAIEQGFVLFDHADIYGRGKAEQVFGDYLTLQPHLREQILIQTKCAIRVASDDAVGRYDFSANYIRRQVELSLRQLQSGYIDILLLHRPDPLMQAEEVAAVLLELQQQGKVKHFGVSNFGWPQLQLLQSHLAQPLMVNQLEMSLSRIDWLEQNVFTGMPQGANHFFSYGTVEYCQLHKVQIQAWGSLAQGLFSGGKKPATPAQQKTADLVAQLAAEYQTTAEAIVLGWLMKHPAGIQPVIGTTQPQRITACAKARGLSLSREHWYALYVASRGAPLP